MCGIFGITINSESKIDLRHFKQMHRELFLLSESRGKEASGFSFLNGKKIIVYKTPRPSSELVKSDIYTNSFKCFDEFEGARKTGGAGSPKFAVGLGHSRLVTNGIEKDNNNNQPVIKSGIVGVHNGIVVNVAELWEKYRDERKYSQLDSEMIFTLIRRFYIGGKSIRLALSETFHEMYGMASIAMVFQDLSNLLLATNNGSIYYARGKDGNSFVFASERHILKMFLGKKDFKLFFDEADIQQLSPMNACLIDIETGDAEFKSISYDSYEGDFKGIKRNTELFKIENLSQQELPVPPEEELEDQDPTVRTVLPKDLNSNKNRCGDGLILYVPTDFCDHFSQNQEKIDRLKRCTRCVLPETFPFIEFDNQGVCNYCNGYSPLEFKGRESLEEALKPYRKNGNAPDCIVAFSGGRDSSYSLDYIKNELGMTPIAYSYDWGMITDLARRNQARLCGKLGIEHILISADIKKKRANIRKNVLAWLKRPSLGTIPLFMAGDKQYFYYANMLMKQNDIKLVVLGENMLETTNFKSGFCGIKPDFNKTHTYSLSIKNKMAMAFYYAKEYLVNPAYLNSSVIDTLAAFGSYYFIPHNYLNLYSYIRWDEREIEKTLFDKFDWETSPDTKSTWRIGDGTASFYNYIYYTLTGFTEFDTFRSNQIREGMMSREDALRIINEENQPRWDSIKWYCDTINIDFESTVEIINRIPKLYSR